MYEHDIDEISDLEYEIGLEEVAIESLLKDMDELDKIEELSIEQKASIIKGISLEDLSTDKIIRNMQKGRESFYNSFIDKNRSLYTKQSTWLRSLESNQKQILNSLKESKSMNTKELSKVVASRMENRHPNIISLINGVDMKQIKLAKKRFESIITRTKRNKTFMRKMRAFADKEFGFSSLIDDKLKPQDVIDYIREQYADEEDLTDSILSIRIFGIKRRFRTDKRKLLIEFLKTPGTTTKLLDWSGNTLKYISMQNTGEMKVIYKKLKNFNTDYTSFYNRYAATITKIISDTTVVDNLIDDMNDAIYIYEKINISLLKLYNSRNKTYDELKYIRRYHLMLVRVIHLRIMDLLSTYRMTLDIAKVIDKVIT